MRTPVISPVVVNQSRQLRVRPIFKEWTLRFTTIINDEILNSSEVKSFIELSGQVVGLGDWRVEKGGSFGTFEVVSFDSVEKAA